MNYPLHALVTPHCLRTHLKIKIDSLQIPLQCIHDDPAIWKCLLQLKISPMWDKELKTKSKVEHLSYTFYLLGLKNLDVAWSTFFFLTLHVQLMQKTSWLSFKVYQSPAASHLHGYHLAVTII